MNRDSSLIPPRQVSKLFCYIMVTHYPLFLLDMQNVWKSPMKTYSTFLWASNMKKHKWQVCGDLKIVATVLGLQLHYMKNCCLLWEWDSRDREAHFKRRKWPRRTSLEPGSKNIVCIPLFTPNLIILPSLHIKLGLMKNFIKAVDHSAAAFLISETSFYVQVRPKLKRAYSLVHRLSSSSRIYTSRKYYVVMKKKLGLLSGW